MKRSYKVGRLVGIYQTSQIIKLFSCLLVLALIVVGLPRQYVHADEPENMEVNGDLLFETEGEPRERTLDEILLENWKNYQLEQSLLQTGNGLMGPVGPSYNVLGVPCYQQINPYYCGPASVKEVLQYKKGTSNTQSYYASLLQTATTGAYPGTVKENIPGVLNSQLGYTHYVISNTSSFSLWKNRVENGINNTFPIILDIATNDNSMPYTTAGHFLVVSGFAFDPGNTTLASVYVADPHPIYYGTAWYSAGTIWQANANHSQPAFIW